MKTLKQIVKSKAFIAFIFGFVLYILTALPELITNKGILIFNADFREQSLPFTFHIRDSILSGNVLWDHSSGLGAQFLSSYAFYNLFSPFTALYLIVPRSAIVYVMPYVMAAKYGFGTMMGYMYAARFLKNKNYAVLAGMLYMFSSINGYNLIFHFDDTVAFFPLLLIALEELCTKNRKGFFAVTAGYMALLNFYFFIGETVFAVIYFFVRGICDKEFGLSVKKALQVLFEGIIGVMCFMAFLLPVAITLIEDNRATSLLEPSEWLHYNSVYNYLKIIQSAFMLPDPFGYTSMFPTTQPDYPYSTAMSSVAAYLPLFSLTGVISYIVKKRKSWESVLLLVFLVMAFVPVLNHLFFALNRVYYARWFFMAMLISGTVTVKALEDGISFKPGIFACGGVLAALIAFPLVIDTEELVLSNQINCFYNFPLTVVHLAVSVLSLGLVIVIVRLKRDREYFPKLFLLSSVGIYMCFGIMFFTAVSNPNGKAQDIAAYEFNTEKPEEMCSDDRIIQSEDYRNFNLIWQNNSPSFFNSMSNKGYTAFFYANVSPETYLPGAMLKISQPELLDLVSLKYAVSGQLDNPLLSDYKHVADFGNYYVLENPNYIPMGFAYDKMISYDEFMRLETQEKHRANMKYIITKDFSQFKDVLAEEKPDDTMSDEEYLRQVENRRAESSYNLQLTRDGLISNIKLPEKRVVMYSVSYNEGWSAYIDGEKSQVYDVNNGLVGVIVPDGDHEVRLSYTVPGFKEGIIISAAALIILAGYIVVFRRKTSASADANNPE